MSGYTEWAVLCWGQRLRDDYPGLDPKVVSAAGGKVVKTATDEVRQVVCLPGTVWKTTTICSVMLGEEYRLKRRIALMKVEKKLGIVSSDCVDLPTWHLLRGASIEP